MVEESQTGDQKVNPADKKEINLKLQIVRSDMTAEYEKSAVEIAMQAFHKYHQPKDIATYIKKEYDKKYPSDGKATSGVYHCIVGSYFAAAISHETRFYLQFKVGNISVILFKSKDSPFNEDPLDHPKADHGTPHVQPAKA
eukprot:jgi/Mesvir1/3468/Mv11961-RA.1